MHNNDGMRDALEMIGHRAEAIWNEHPNMEAFRWIADTARAALSVSPAAEPATIDDLYRQALEQRALAQRNAREMERVVREIEERLGVAPVQYRCLWKERMGSACGLMWIPFSGRVHASIEPCIVERANRMADPKFRHVQIEARPMSDDAWPRPWEVRQQDKEAQATTTEREACKQ